MDKQKCVSKSSEATEKHKRIVGDDYKDCYLFFVHGKNRAVNLMRFENLFCKMFV